jgi:hypothetical protein
MLVGVLFHCELLTMTTIASAVCSTLPLGTTALLPLHARSHCRRMHTCSLLEFPRNTSDDEFIMPYLLSYGCDCLVASFPICLTCLCTVYRSIAHGILIRLPPARSRHYESHPQGAEWVDRNVYSCPNPLTQMKSQMRSFNSVAGTRSQSLVRIVVRHAVCGSVTTSSLDLLQHAR